MKPNRPYLRSVCSCTFYMQGLRAARMAERREFQFLHGADGLRTVGLRGRPPPASSHSRPVPGGGDSHRIRAVSAAVVQAARLHAMPDDLASAVLAGRRESVDRALEGIE